MSWIATIVFCTLAFTCAGCMLTARPVICDDEQIPMPKPRPENWEGRVSPLIGDFPNWRKK